MPRCAVVGLVLGIVAGGSVVLAKPAGKAPVQEAPGATPSPALTVSFDVQQLIGEKPPVLAIKLTNTSTQAMPYSRFEGARCIVDFLLNLTITGPDDKPMVLTPCVVKSWPGTDANLAAGGTDRLLVPLADLADKWPLGTYSIGVQWNPARLEAARGIKVPRALQTSLNSHVFSIVRPLAQLRIRRGETVKLPGGIRFTFAGHGHKNVEPGDTSPLIIYGKITTSAAVKDEDFSVNLHTEHSRIFRAGDDRVFEVVNYAYDDWMELRYYGRISPATL